MPLKGVNEVTGKLRSVRAKHVNEHAQAAYQEMSIELTEMKRRTPIDTHALRDSGRVEFPTITGNIIEVGVVFGGPAIDYAFIVHEDPEAFHPHGQYKYVESVLDESGPHLPARIARRINLNRML